MDKHSSNLSMTTCGHKFFVWVLLVAFGVSSIPSAAFAQQAAMTISVLNGTALVNGQETTQGAVLSINDSIETQAGASLVLTLADGSTVSLGENTKVDLAELSQATTGVRVSRLKLLWGRVRAVLSPAHQQAGSTFDIETPNALIGVKFSQPDVEVIYDIAQEETIGIAHTVELIAINLLTNERVIVPVGSTVTIAGMLMTLVEGTTAAAIAAEAGGIVLTTKTIAIGAGALVGLGGLAVVAAGGGGDGGSSGTNTSFTGRFYNPNAYQVTGYALTLDLTQNGSSITGTHLVERSGNTIRHDVNGIANGSYVELRLINGIGYWASTGQTTSEPDATREAELVDDGRGLYLSYSYYGTYLYRQ